MAWVRIDDGFPEHPKALAVGLLGQAVHIGAICWSNRMLTDGFIPLEALPRLTGWSLAKAKQQAEMLVKAGLWHDSEAVCRDKCPGGKCGGYQIHDYLEFQGSKDDVLAFRGLKAQSGHIGGLRSGEARRSKREANDEANDEANGKQTAKQTRSETKQHPKEEEELKKDSPNGESKETPPLAAVPPKRERHRVLTEDDLPGLQEEFATLDVVREAAKWRDWKASKGKHFNDNVAAFRNWLRNEEDYVKQRGIQTAGHASQGRARAAVRAGPGIEGWEQYAANGGQS